MRELSNEAQAMLDLARDVHDPNEQDRRRLTGAMIARLGAAAVISSSTTLAGASGGAVAGTGVVVGALGAVKTLAAVVVAGGMSAAVLWQVSGGEPSRPTAPHAPVAHSAPRPELPAAPPVTAVEAVAEPAPVAVVAPAPRAPKRAAPTALSSALGLSEQVRVLARSREALRQGRAAEALALLDGNAAVFRTGALREEFLAARVMCLRELGRETEASSAARDFESEMPRSPLVPKVTRPKTEPP